MNVTLRQRNKNGKISLYLDLYHNGNRKYEYLRLYLIDNPRTKLEKETNKKTLQLAKNIQSKRQLELQNEVYNFRDIEKTNSSFLKYFKLLTEKRNESNGNHGNWLSAFKHLNNWGKADVTFADINVEWLEDFKYYLLHDAHTRSNKKLSKNSCVSYFNKVRAALNQAVKDNIIIKNPAKKVNGIKKVETRREFLTYEELKKVSKTYCENDIIKRAFLFSALTGLRFSDIEKLTWSEIQHSEENGYYIRFQQQKTKGQETLPISIKSISLLGERQNGKNKIFKGLTYSDSNNEKILKWMIRSGIEKHITFHCARHTYATLQLTLGTDIYTVSKLLGHKNLKTTELYAKIINKKKITAANIIKL